MQTRSHTIKLVVPCLLVSLTAHVMAVKLAPLFAAFDFTAPVSVPPNLLVELSAPPLTVQPPPAKLAQQHTLVPLAKLANKSSATAPLMPVDTPTAPIPPAAAVATHQPPDITTDNAAQPPASTQSSTLGADSHNAPFKTGNFLSAAHETLEYRIQMFGIPVGSAQLEAHAANGDTLISLHVQSNNAFSAIYPVHNVIETRHVAERYLMATVRQQEGSFRSDETLTINPEKMRVSWSDNLRGKQLKETLPNREVLDTLSGIYYLRTRSLQVGTTETLHIFDGEMYAEVPVEILRCDTVRLANLTDVDTLVVRPMQKSAGIFRRTGDIVLWLTNDARKVPVKIVTTIALGEVTAELVSSKTSKNLK